jgi:hypothetical protein
VPRNWAALAQLVEHRIRNAGVRCSNHLGGTISFNDLADIWPSFESLLLFWGHAGGTVAPHFPPILRIPLGTDKTPADTHLPRARTGPKIHRSPPSSAFRSSFRLAEMTVHRYDYPMVWAGILPHE